MPKCPTGARHVAKKGGREKSSIHQTNHLGSLLLQPQWASELQISMDRFLLLTQIPTSAVRTLPWKRSLQHWLPGWCWSVSRAQSKVHPSIHMDTQDTRCPWHCREELSPVWSCPLCPAVVFPAVLWEQPGAVTTSPKKSVSKQLWGTSCTSPRFRGRKSMLPARCSSLLQPLKQKRFLSDAGPAPVPEKLHSKVVPGAGGCLFLVIHGSTEWFFWKIPPLWSLKRHLWLCRIP